MMDTTRPPIALLSACLAGLLFLPWGCRKTADPPEPKVIVQRVTVPRTPDREGKAPQPEERAPAAAAVPPVGEPQKALPEAGVTDRVDEASGPDIETEPAETVQPPKPVYAYNPKGKIDPFLPYTEAIAAPQRTPEKPDVRVPSTPLETMDLGQLKLVGIILSRSGNRALVEDAESKGYIISKGTYIGRNSGKVTRILRDKVIITESVSYGGSEATTRRQELELQKPPGDD